MPIIREQAGVQDRIHDDEETKDDWVMTTGDRPPFVMSDTKPMKFRFCEVVYGEFERYGPIRSVCGFANREPRLNSDIFLTPARQLPPPVPHFSTTVNSIS